MRKNVVLLAAAVMFAASPLFAAGAAETLTGTISDSMCGAKHAGGEHGGKKMTDKECTDECVKSGAKYVFASGDKIYKIANQDFAGLKSHSGEKVALTGETKDDTITVSKIAAAK